MAWRTGRLICSVPSASCCRKPGSRHRLPTFRIAGHVPLPRWQVNITACTYELGGPGWSDPPILKSTSIRSLAVGKAV
jgi:hypothetical protein